VGLIGGSIGRAAKARGVAGHVVGVGRNRVALEQAQSLGAIDEFTTDLAEGVAKADLVVVCTPVDKIVEVIRAAAAHAVPGTIFTDAGSVKGGLEAAVSSALSDEHAYVPAHPIAGSEQRGVANARADLFENRVTVITAEDRHSWVHESSICPRSIMISFSR
jgi:prephenate dehydrogenase